jgi:hypothetical protein
MPVAAVTDIAEHIELVCQIAATTPPQRSRHFCKLYHERLVQITDVRRLSVMPTPAKANPGGAYPQCNELGLETSIGCAHDLSFFHAILSVLKHLQEQPLAAATTVQIVHMNQGIRTRLRRLVGEHNLDDQMHVARTILFEDNQRQTETLEAEHSEIVQYLFTCAEQAADILNMLHSTRV